MNIKKIGGLIAIMLFFPLMTYAQSNIEFNFSSFQNFECGENSFQNISVWDGSDWVDIEVKFTIKNASSDGCVDECEASVTEEGIHLSPGLLEINFSNIPGNIVSVDLAMEDLCGDGCTEAAIHGLGEVICSNQNQGTAQTENVSLENYDPASMPVQIMTINTCDAIIKYLNIHYDHNCNPEAGLIWPGDANSDGLVNNFDLLQVGLALGTSGSERSNASSDWMGQFCEDWDSEIFNDWEGEVNSKFADCDGNGIIERSDSEIIALNYSEVHNKTEGSQSEGDSNDPHLFVELPNLDLIQGQEFEAQIILGTEIKPVDEIYGIAFTVSFDEKLFAPGTEEIDFKDSWLGYNLETITITKFHPILNKVDIAIISTEGFNLGGGGPIAGVKGIIDNIAGKTNSIYEYTISIENVRGINKDGVEVPLYSYASTGNVISSVEEKLDPNGSIKIFPNPTSEFVNIEGLEFDKVEIYNLEGKIVSRWEGTSNDQLQLPLDHLQSGNYLIVISRKGAQAVRKLNVARKN